MSTDCIFWKIIRGELPSYKVYEDDLTVALIDMRGSLFRDTNAA